MRSVITSIVAVVLLVGIGWALGEAINYDTNKMAVCKAHNLVMVQEWPAGKYGCGKVIPFDRFEKK